MQLKCNFCKNWRAGCLLVSLVCSGSCSRQECTCTQVWPLLLCQKRLAGSLIRLDNPRDSSNWLRRFWEFVAVKGLFTTQTWGLKLQSDAFKAHMEQMSSETQDLFYLIFFDCLKKNFSWANEPLNVFNITSSDL